MGEKERDFDKEAQSWDQNPGRIRMAADVARAIREETGLSPTMDVLDFGCGTGLLTLAVQPLVHTVTGVDSSRGMLDVLEAKVRDLKLSTVRTLQKDLTRGETLEGSYHLIVSSMTLHHIRTIGPVLHELARVLLPGGHLCIADLDPDDGMFHTGNEGVFHFGFARPVLKQALSDAGFTDIRDRTAASVEKPLPQGGSRIFTVFLMTGRKAG